VKFESGSVYFALCLNFIIACWLSDYWEKVGNKKGLETFIFDLALLLRHFFFFLMRNFPSAAGL
jgi:hypothetical protein